MRPRPIRSSWAAGSYCPEARLHVLLRSAFDLQQPSCTLLQLSGNDTYLVRDGAHRFVLRLCAHTKREADVRFELDLIDAVQAAPIVRGAEAVRTRDQQRFAQLPMVEGQRIALLFAFAPGKIPDAWRLTSRQATTCGRALATMHARSAGLCGGSRLTADDIASRPADELAPWLDRAQRSQYRKILARCQPALRAWNAAEAVPIHGDYAPCNLSIDPTGTVTVFDFDLAGRGWRAWDLATFLSGIGLQHPRQNVPPPAWRAFLHAYSRLRPLDTEEIALLPHLAVLKELRFIAISQHIMRQRFGCPFEALSQRLGGTLDRCSAWLAEATA